MRQRTDGRLLAAVIALTVAAAGGTSFLAGCGSGSRTITVPVSSIGSFLGRSYTANNVALGTYGTGNVVVSVDNNGHVTATVTFINPTTHAVLGTANLGGTLNTQTGAYSLSGTYTPTGGQATPVAVTGTLPTPPATAGGSATVTVGTVVGTSTFTSSTSGSPTPSPSTSASPGASPSPSTSPSASPSPGGTTLGSYYSGFQSTANDTFTYQYTDTSTLNPDPNHQSRTTTDTFTFHGGSLFYSGSVGAKDTVTIHLPKSGDKVVTREQELNPSDNSVIGYLYYTEDANGHTDYGSDTLYRGTTTHSTRYDAGRMTPFTLGVGASFTQTYTVYETNYSPLDGTSVTSAYNYDETDTDTFVGVETVTVQGGTYTNCAHFRARQQYTLPALAAEYRPTDEPHDETFDGWLSKYVGIVKSTGHTVIQNQTGTNNSTGQAFTYVETDDFSEELVSATVNGVNYPPGRAFVQGRSSSVSISPTLVQKYFRPLP